MQKILNAKQLLEADKITIKNKNISSLELMEHASKLCFEWIHNRLQGNPLPIHVFCGIGNNGGDGLVISRMLKKYGYNINVYIVNFSKKRSNDFLTNYDRLKELGLWPKTINSEENFPVINENDMVIDAIFGIGLNRNPKGIAKKTIKHINQSNAYVLSIDMPSGLFVSKTISDKESVIKAFQTLTFETPKLAFLLPENNDFSVNTEIILIGLDKKFIKKQKSDFYTTEKQDILNKYKFRSKFSHKGNFGHSLIIGGSFGKIGAVTLASKACLKVGSGLVTAYIPKCGYNILQTSIPEIMVEVDSENEIEHFNFKTKPNCIGIGVGMGTSYKTEKAFENFLKNNKVPLVIDADAINLLSKNKSLLKFIPKGSILTPHPKELKRLIGKWKNDYEKLEKIKDFSLKNNLILILKGYNTAIAYKNKIYFNQTGNPALATAGSGDVLTGLITGLLAQGYTSLNASIIAVYLHGKTADIALNNQVYETFLASDIIELLPQAFIDLFSKEDPNTKPLSR